MAFGLPYMGSKNIYAKQICEALPSGNRLVDLFAGGCAVTDCAIRKYSNKWESFLINDIAHERLERLERLELSECPEVLKRLKFSYLSYEQYEYCDGDVVYCDIPYRKTRCEAYKETGFDHEAFWEWAKSRPFDVYVSERIVPSDAEVVLTKKLQSRANPGNTVGQVTEYLVRV